MILVVFRKGYCWLVVQKKCCWLKICGKELWEWGTKPKSFLGSIGCSHIFGLGGWKGNNFLAFHTPQNGTAMQNESVPGDGMPILCHTPIHIHWEVQHESDWRNTNTKTHTQAEQGSMTKWHDPHKLVSVDTNKSWLWLCVCNLFEF